MQERDLIQSELHEALELLTPPQRREELTKKVSATRSQARRLCRRWLANSSIIGLGVGPRLTNGQETGDLALRVHVRKKKAMARLGEKRIPPAIRLPGIARAVLIDVIESEIPTTQEALAGDGLKLRGSTISGTIGCVVQRANSQDLFAVTCFHVLDGKKQDVVEWTEFPPAPNPPNPVIGQLAFMSNLLSSGNFPNKTDIALVRLGVDSVSPDVRGLGRISGIRTSPLIPGERVRLCGLGTSEMNTTTSSGLCQGKVVSVGVLRNIDYGPRGLLGFRNLVSCTSFTQERDSGAAVLDDNNRLVGIHMAGTSATATNAESLFQPISAVVTEFGVSVSGTVPAAPIAPLAAAATPARAVPPTGNMADAIDILARTIWGEARGEPNAGRRGVANVVVNRTLHSPPERFGGTVEAVCRRRSQFSCWNVNDPNRPKLLAVTDSDLKFRECLEIAREAVKGALVDNTVGSDHYHAKGITPDWVEGRAPVIPIGKHLFYNNIR